MALASSLPCNREEEAEYLYFVLLMTLCDVIILLITYVRYVSTYLFFAFVTQPVKKRFFAPTFTVGFFFTTPEVGGEMLQVQQAKR